MPHVPRDLVLRLGRRTAVVLITLLAIAYLTVLGLLLAERGRKGLPSDLLGAAGESLNRTALYVVEHPATYYWHRTQTPALGLVATAFARSAGLLLLALGIAALVGVPLGVVAALRRRRGAPLIVLLSVLGVSTPSFLLAMLIWVLVLQGNRNLGLPTLPATGYGWDKHAILPALVLAARPLAQVMQVTYVTLCNVLDQDYTRTARGKGLSERRVLLGHAMKNARIPVLTTFGNSLRFALASLPVVESFFLWPGLGLTLLQAIQANLVPLVTDLTVALGLLFLSLNLVLDTVYPLLDRRLAGNDTTVQSPLRERVIWREQLGNLLAALRSWPGHLKRLFTRSRRPRSRSSGQGSLPVSKRGLVSGQGDPCEAAMAPALSRDNSSRRYLLRSTAGNPALLAGSLLVVGLLALALFGDRLATANPYETHGVMTIAGKIGVPPFAPSPVFPWGSDQVGRDIQSLVLSGAKRTLALALFATLARVVLGAVLGGLAGWWQGGRLDRLVTGAMGVWAAFPATIFAMILIQALGIKQGMGVFVVALSVVGWDSVAQFVRGQVVSIKPQPYLESAHAAGARSDRILLHYALPNVLPSLLVLAVLETGGVLMLLAELGFLNVFLGGGFRSEIAVDQVFFYSDVPEWGAMLANIRNWWRGYPWLAWYPGLFFFLAILAFNLWGEGLRRFLDETRINVNHLFNRYSLLAGLGIIVALFYVLQSTAPLGLYRIQARQFDATRAMADVRALAAPDLAGRETGTGGGEAAAQYVARRMQEAGLFPAGEHDTFFRTYPCAMPHLAGGPVLRVGNPQAGLSTLLAYRQDFAEYATAARSDGKARGTLVGLALGPHPGTNGADPYNLRSQDLSDKILLMREVNGWPPEQIAAAGVLIITSDPRLIEQRQLFRNGSSAMVRSSVSGRPIMYVSEAAAGAMLEAMGSSLADLDASTASLAAGEAGMIRPGPEVELAIPSRLAPDLAETCQDVIGYIPGIGALQGARPGAGLDHQVIVVSAYYDGAGRGPDGQVYPGANDNASAVAAMLEMARVMKTGAYQPQKTVVFVAWAGGERGESLDLSNVMNSRVGFSQLRPEAVIQLNGLGAGSGQGIALGTGSSYRLTQLLEQAAGRMGVEVTTRGRDPHFGLRPGSSKIGQVLNVQVSWDGSDQDVHTPRDTVESLDERKLQKAGQTVLLALTVASREVDY